MGGEAPIQQLGQSAADHGSHGLRRMWREIELGEGSVQRRGKVEHGIGQRAVEIEDDRFGPNSLSSPGRGLGRGSHRRVRHNRHAVPELPAPTLRGSRIALWAIRGGPTQMQIQSLLLTPLPTLPLKGGGRASGTGAT